LMAKSAIEKSYKEGLHAARESLHRSCVDVMRAYKSVSSIGMGYGQQQQSPLCLPESMQLLPLYTMALQKNVVFRGGTDVHADERCFLMQKLSGMQLEDSRVFIYPRLFNLADMPPEVGQPVEGEEEDEGVVVAGKQRIRIGSPVNLSVERLSSDGAFLLEDGRHLFLWLGKALPQQFLQSCFSLDSLEGIDCNQLILLQNPDDLCQRVNNIVNALREERSTYMQLKIVREGDPQNESRFFWHLVEDRASFTGGTYSYPEFLNHVTRQSTAGYGAAAPQQRR